MSVAGQLVRCDGNWPLHIARDETTTYCGEPFTVAVIWPLEHAGIWCIDCMKATLARPDTEAAGA